MNIKEIQKLIKFVSKSKAKEVSLELKDFKITIKTGDDGNKDQQSLVIPTQNQPIIINKDDLETESKSDPSHKKIAPTTEKRSEDENLITVKSPIIGTFYRKPAPDKESFVEVGGYIKEGDVLCVIEAMKLFNEIESEVSGKIVKVLVEDSSPVEFEQPLFLIDPS
ncbi:MAG: acetyl-CoA carboxylase biotin carboxyl carrier protein [Flavobacteriaceae bacterium]|tara:strand:+ start:349 stop:846 length:498 start_codon:yes stop_codon:yes gene_type:complete